jgi:hypothetical protein
MKTKQPLPQLQRSATSVRQQRYRQRMEDSGYRRVTLWLHQDSEQKGYERGLNDGKFLPVPDGFDTLSYCTGWLRGAGERQLPTFCTCCQNQMSHGAARDYYDLFTMRPFELICDECEELIKIEKKEK